MFDNRTNGRCRPQATRHYGQLPSRPPWAHLTIQPSPLDLLRDPTPRPKRASILSHISRRLSTHLILFNSSIYLQNIMLRKQWTDMLSPQTKSPITGQSPAMDACCELHNQRPSGPRYHLNPQIPQRTKPTPLPVPHRLRTFTTVLSKLTPIPLKHLIQKAPTPQRQPVRKIPHPTSQQRFHRQSTVFRQYPFHRFLLSVTCSGTIRPHRP